MFSLGISDKPLVGLYCAVDACYGKNSPPKNPALNSCLSCIRNMSDNYPPSVLVMVDVRFLWHIGNSFVKSVLELKKNEQKNLYAINILSTQAVELLLKSIIASGVCLEKSSADEITLKNMIDEKFRNLGHRIDMLFGAVPDIRELFMIDEIIRFNETGYVDEYRISFKNSEHILCFKDLEGARYGSFSKNKDIMTVLQHEDTGDFLQKLSEEAHKKMTEVSCFLQNISTK